MADSVTDGTVDVYTFGAVNRFEYVSIDTFNTDGTDRKLIYSTDTRYGVFEADAQHNHDMYITDISSSGVTINNIQTFVTRYRPDTSRNHNRLVTGFMRGWCTENLSRACTVTVHYPTMIYDTRELRGQFFDYVLAGSSGNISARFTGILCTKNETTGEVVKKSVNASSNLSSALNFGFWSADKINEYYPSFTGTYWLESVNVTITALEGLTYLQFGGSSLADTSLERFQYDINLKRDMGADGLNFSFGWLLDAVEAFLAFEILPGIKLYLILTSIAGFGLLMWFIKMFAGG